ncbi:endonuclease/exonuclease/phosphatase family protein [Dysgonomonas sp. HDW5B]|uniref:endonuclease/exonuclease/phosphatase family protein n=1 Tax=Dysgonomonas sp. HDW5B TaxID=2714927 RepID=UPI00140725D3|nr:endonuclease/exonuclease/phosphatase family protein [Dysgonomonas sp. HDW5B]QIK53215.1 endonuclease/exonuclease/phosphatase family protein [Dysgonomonas sp. HDW5B]
MGIKGKHLVINVSKGLKYLILTVNVLVALLLLLSTLAPVTSPFDFVIISYLGLGFPILLFINVCFFILWLVFLKWKYFVIQLVILLFCWNSINTYIPLNSPSKDIPEKSFKIMSYNVRGFDWLTGDEARNNPIFSYMANSGADIICMQEFAVEEKKDKDKIISLEELDGFLEEYPYRTIIRLGDTINSCMYGLACYSKFPIEKVARIPIESAFNGAGMYEIKIGKKSLTIVNNHLESNRLTAEDKVLFKELVVDKNRKKLDAVTQTIRSHLDPAFKTRATQANIIADCIRIQREKTDAMIVCGDFNEPPISYAYETIKGNFLDAFKYTGRGVGITYHEDGFYFRIDYIMHSLNLQAYNCTVGDVKYSDHYPIWAWIKFK